MTKRRLVSDILHKKEMIKQTQKRLNLPDRVVAELMRSQLIRLKTDLKDLLNVYTLKYKKAGNS